MKIVVGISGGVDSAVAAYLLKKEGYEVIGLFMKNWDSTINNDVEGQNNTVCTQELDYYDAQKVCDSLGIKLYRIDFVKEYWDNVFEYFLKELKAGRTPNPDIMCNKYIKFDLFYKYAKTLKADKIATGHYAKLIDGQLYKPLDKNKDQTYFLGQVNRDIFKDVLFPLENINKSDVRKIAKEANIPVFNKKDSTGICFIGERHYQDFVKNYLKKNAGNIINIENNEVIGRHEGLMFYTIGQRKGVGLSGNLSRHFVVGKSVSKNELYVAFDKANEYLTSTKCTLTDVNYLSLDKPENVEVKFRYRSKETSCKAQYENDSIILSYTAAKSVTPGQSAMLYDADKCIASGIIDKVYKNDKEIWYL